MPVEDLLSGYKTCLSLRIDWSELDLFGHVNNVMFFKYMQAARVAYWGKIGLAQDHLNTGKGPILASATCDFRKPLHYPGNIIIYTRVAFVHNTSFGMSHIIVNENGETAAEGKDVVVMFDFRKNEKMTLPDDFRNAIESLEGRGL